MKSVGLYKQLAKNKMLKVNGIHRTASSNHPICRVCNKPIEVMEIKDRGPDPDYPKWFEIYAKCHGKEDFSRVECPTGMSPDMWSTVISTGAFFSPEHEDSNGGVRR
jgi:hypothetical protein